MFRFVPIPFLGIPVFGSLQNVRNYDAKKNMKARVKRVWPPLKRSRHRSPASTEPFTNAMRRHFRLYQNTLCPWTCRLRSMGSRKSILMYDISSIDIIVQIDGQVIHSLKAFLIANKT